jgi:ABC-type uncharacterized transport system substrate-binding protein
MIKNGEVPMARRCVVVGLALAILAGWAASTEAAGVFIVSRAGVPAYNDAKAGFMQVAYASQLAGFNPKSVELNGTAADDAALAALKAQNPTIVYAVGSYAAKKVREAVPDAWVIYGMVYYPEVEGFSDDPKMIGIASLGPPNTLAGLLKALGGRTKGLVILHSDAIQKAVPNILSRLNAGGFEATAKSVASAKDLQSAFDAVKDQAKAILLLPDPVTSSPDAVRFVVSQCVASKIPPVSLNEGMVSDGVLCASFYPPASIGNQAAKVAQALLASGQPPQDRLVPPIEFQTALNVGTAGALGLKPPKGTRIEVTYE